LFHFWNRYKINLLLTLWICLLSNIFLFLWTYVFAENTTSIKNIFQNPTYLLEKEFEKEVYECDQSQTECKVNFDLRQAFSWFTESKYSCYIDFWFPTWEEEKCNPITIIFPIGKDYSVTTTIQEKTNLTNKIQRQIIIKNTPPPFSFPDITFDIQSGLELSLSGSYECKTASCSVNLTVEHVFTGFYSVSKYWCFWNFWSGILDNTGSINDCNPSYVSYPFFWEQKIELQLFEKANPSNFKTGFFTFFNTKITPPIDTWSGTTLPDSGTGTTQTGSIDTWSGTTSTSTWTTLTGSTDSWTSSGTTHTWTTEESGNIPDIIIDFQSPSYINATASWNYLCDSSKDECKLNIDLRQTFWGSIPAKFECLINSPLFSWETDFCNPNTIVIPEGEHSISFRIFEKNNPNNFQEKTIYVSNLKPFLEVPVPSIEIQSGLKTNNSWSLECTNYDCSINLTGGASFLWTLTSKFSCLWDFWTGSIDGEWEKEKCNPSYVKFSPWNHSISLSIFEKVNLENKKTTFLTFENTFLETISDFIPPLKLSFQSPSYVNYTSWDGETLTCDPRESDCKINFNLEETFPWVVPSKYECRNDFWFFTWEEGKCNPNTIIFPGWKTQVTFRLQEKDNPSNFQEKIIFILKNQTSVWWWSLWWWVSVPSTKEIILQSGGEKSGDTITCHSEICKINLKYPQSSWEYCLWDFWTINMNPESKNTCNPYALAVFPGISQISLQIFSKKTNELLQSSTLTLHNQYIPPDNQAPVAKITLQWKLSSKRLLDWNHFTCYTKKMCSVNLSAEESYDPNRDTLDFTWWFGQGEVSNKKNPPAFEYPLGNYQVRLKVSDGKSSSEEYFFIEVKDEKLLKEEEEILPLWEIPRLRILSLKPNPSGRDEKEYIEIQNLSFKKVNLKGVIIENSKKKFIFKEDYFLKPFESKKFYKTLTNITFGNTSDFARISYWDQEIDFLTWNFKVPDGYILTHENLEIETQNALVLEVIDGDTILVKLSNGSKEKVRLIGVDTPETVHPNKALEAFWKEASDYTKKLLSWQEIRLELDNENTRDIYGRLLAYVYIWDEMINKKLISEWYARAYLRYPFRYSAEFEKAQSEAKKEKRWLWADKELAKLINEELKEEQILEQKINKDMLSYLWNLDISFFSFEQIKNYLSHVWKHPWMNYEVSKNGTLKNIKKVKTDFNKIPFRISFSKLKSGFKISGTTLPNAQVLISGYNVPIEIQVGTDGKFLYKIEHWLIAGDYILSYKVQTDKKIFEIEGQKRISLGDEYVGEVDKKWQKKLASLEKKKKTKKKKTKKPKTPKKNPVYKISQESLSIKNEDTSQNIPLFLYYLVWIFWIFWLSLVIHKKDLFDKK
jgi:micrococcal nuclease